MGKSMIKEFRTTTFIPMIARDRKSKIDGLLMSYKKENSDFRYIVRNGERDIRVLIKRTSEGDRYPYRELSLDVLGRISPLKTQIREVQKEQAGDDDENEYGYTVTGSGHPKRANLPKHNIHTKWI